MAENITLAGGDDPAMLQAYAQARADFRLFWREVAWDRRRIVPALDLAAVKAPFTDGPRTDDHPEVEHMWVTGVDWDGLAVTGALANDPGWLASVRAGDPVRVPVGELSDWMFVIGGRAFGAHTVAVLRARMDPRERRAHDAAWGLDFGGPGEARAVSEELHRQLSETAADALRERLAADPALVTARGLNGWTLLHQDASAGSAATVRALLAAGADPRARTDQGLTPRGLAGALGWDEVAALLPADD